MIYQQVNHQEQPAEQPHSLYGNNIVICHPECMLGPHYYVFIPTFLCVSVLFIVLYSNVKQLISPLWSIIILASIIILMISYILVGFSNPGVIVNKIDNQIINQNQLNQKICQQCGVSRPNGARHCKECNCCILGHDHHCPWIGKCVGELNKGRFFFFLVMMFGTLILFFIGTIATGSKSQSKQNNA